MHSKTCNLQQNCQQILFHTLKSRLLKVCTIKLSVPCHDSFESWLQFSFFLYYCRNYHAFRRKCDIIPNYVEIDKISNNQETFTLYYMLSTLQKSCRCANDKQGQQVIRLNQVHWYIEQRHCHSTTDRCGPSEYI